MRRSLLLALALAACSEREPVAAEPPVADAAPRPELTTAAASPPARPAPDGARYTSLEGCRLLRAEPEEAGFSEELCPGVDGYALKRNESDGRQNLVLVRPGGAEFNPQLPSWSGGGFSSLGPRVEWRGSPASALIFRYSVVMDPEEPTRPTSYLVVMRLDGAAPCLVGRAPPGPGQNGEARRLAEAPGECLPIPE